MLLKYFYDERLAQASYLIGCTRTGEAMVVDPARNVDQYIKVAADKGLRITHVTETHIHADFVSGARELALRTGAALYLSDMGDANWKYTYADADRAILVRDGDNWMVGNIRVEVLHTPGHTPEHIAFLITDTAAANKPIGVFSGDFLFVGDVGRPDLLEEAAGFVGIKEVGARQQFKSIERFKQMPDYLQIWPGHGAGSACGKALGAIPSTTLGYEKLFNPAFQFTDETAFVRWLLDGQPEAPRYFAQMKYVNKTGPMLLKDLPQPQKLDRPALDAALCEGAFVADLRSSREFAEGYVPGTISIPTSSANFTTYIGWLVDYTRPTYLMVTSDMRIEPLLEALRAIGVDNVPGYFTSEVIGEQAAKLPEMTAAELAECLAQNSLMILDVRGASEYAELHIAGAKHIPLGFLPRHLDAIPKDRLIVTQCASGYRSQIAASLLRRYGFTNVVNLVNGTEIWSKRLPTERSMS